MKTKQIRIDGLFLTVPASYVKPQLPVPDCCGAGDGLSQILVPETVYGLRISLACHIHDESWRAAERTVEDFNQTNMMFLANLLEIIRARSTNSFIRALRSYRAMTYYTAVQEAGFKHFIKNN